MDAKKRELLIDAGADMDGAMERFMDNETLYMTFLHKFTVTPNYTELKNAIEKDDWEHALEISHNLKGSSGSLGFTHLYELLSAQVADIRKDDRASAAALMDDIMAEYHRLVDAVKDIA